MVYPEPIYDAFKVPLEKVSDRILSESFTVENIFCFYMAVQTALKANRLF